MYNLSRVQGLSIAFLWCLSDFHPLHFLIFDYLVHFHFHATEVGWSVQVHFGGGLLKTSSFAWILLSFIKSKPDFSPIQI